MQNPLKLAGVPQTNETVSVASMPNHNKLPLRLNFYLQSTLFFFAYDVIVTAFSVIRHAVKSCDVDVVENF